MRIPKRFALSTLMLLMLLVSLVLGYAQWRRQRIIADVKWLNEMNGRLTVGHGVAVEQFQTLPTFVVGDGIAPEVRVMLDTVIPIKYGRLELTIGVVPVRFVKLDRDSYSFSDGAKTYRLEELKEQLREVQRRLNAIGFNAIEFHEHRSGTFFNNHVETSDIDEIGK